MLESLFKFVGQFELGVMLAFGTSRRVGLGSEAILGINLGFVGQYIALGDSMPHHQVEGARVTTFLQDTLSVLVNKSLWPCCLRSYSAFKR